MNLSEYESGKIKETFFELGIAFARFSAKPDFSSVLQSSEDGNGQIFDNLDEPPTIFDDDVLTALQLTIDEASNCYNAKCYMATIVLCGKIIETLLAHAYEWLTGENPVKKQLAFNRVRNRLSQDHNVLHVVDTQLRLIYQRRKDTPISTLRRIYRQAGWDWN